MTQKCLQLSRTWDEKFGLHDNSELPQKLVFVPSKTSNEDSNSELKAAGNFPPHCGPLSGRLFVQEYNFCIKNQYIVKMVNHFAEEFLSSHRTTREITRGSNQSKLEQAVEAMLEKKDLNVSLPMKIRAVLLDRIRKSNETLNRSNSRDTPCKTEVRLPTVLSNNSEFSKNLRQLLLWNQVVRII